MWRGEVSPSLQPPGLRPAVFRYPHSGGGGLPCNASSPRSRFRTRRSVPKEAVPLTPTGHVAVADAEVTVDHKGEVGDHVRQGVLNYRVFCGRGHPPRKPRAPSQEMSQGMLHPLCLRVASDNSSEYGANNFVLCVSRQQAPSAIPSLKKKFQSQTKLRLTSGWCCNNTS